jgi:hypothetical protein
MDLFDQPNVKAGTVAIGWHHRSFCNEIMLPIYFAMVKVWTVVLKWRHYDATKSQKLLSVQLNWNKTGTNKEIISELKDRLLFHRRLQSSRFWKILKYDFDPKTAGSENAVMRLFNYMIKTHNSNSFKTTIMNRRHFWHWPEPLQEVHFYCLIFCIPSVRKTI